MAHLTGLLLIDAPAAALNNSGAMTDERTDNIVHVKQIVTRGRASYPYVSAQAFRYWLRTTLETSEEIEWVHAPVFREAKIAYTDANPIKYWDDDLFGYMRAQSKKTGARQADDTARASETLTTTTITRVSPFRVSTLVAIAPGGIVDDFGVMARQEGNPVPHEHQFYRATLKGLLSLDLRSAGTFWSSDKTGFKNLDDTRIEEAKQANLLEEVVDNTPAFRLSNEERSMRIASLLKGIANLEGGAKQALHYTDVTPSFLLFAVTRGGNNIFHHTIRADRDGNPQLDREALEEVIRVYADQLLSPLYIGWPQGYMSDQRQQTIDLLEQLKEEQVLSGYLLHHPRKVMYELAEHIQDERNYHWIR